MVAGLVRRYLAGDSFRMLSRWLSAEGIPGVVWIRFPQFRRRAEALSSLVVKLSTFRCPLDAANPPPKAVPRAPGKMVRRLRRGGGGGVAAGRVMTAQAREHSITTIVQDPRCGTDGTVRVTCTCGELREESPSYRTGLDYLVSEELHHQGLTVPEAMARELLAAVHAHGEGHRTASAAPIRSARTARLSSQIRLSGFRSRDEVESSLVTQGYRVLDVRQAPDRPGREFVFIAERTT